MNSLHSFRTKKKFESYRKSCENKDFCNVILSTEDTKMLQFNQYQEPDKVPFIIYADLECIIENVDGCKKNLEKSSASNLTQHIPSDFSMSITSSFRSIKNKHNIYRGNGCLRNLCESLRDENENN